MTRLETRRWRSSTLRLRAWIDLRGLNGSTDSTTLSAYLDSAGSATLTGIKTLSTCKESPNTTIPADMSAQLQPLSVYLVNAFTTTTPHSGNQAGVVIFPSNDPRATDDEYKFKVAKDINYSETAFLVPISPGRWNLRWFTPEVVSPPSPPFHPMSSSWHRDTLHASAATDPRK